MEPETLSFRGPERGIDHRGRPYRLPFGAWWRGAAATPARRFVFWCALGGVYIVSIAVAALAPDRPGWPAVLLVSPLGCFTFFVAVPLLYRLATHAVVPAGVRLAHYCCGSCGYDLRGLPLEEDGCTLCPECSAAWRLRPRCRACGGHLTDQTLPTHGWYECLSCGECWRDAPPATPTEVQPEDPATTSASRRRRSSPA